MAEAAPRGRFVWYDLLTTDSAAAQDFYTKLFGWTTQQWENPSQPYTMWSTNGAMLGGFMDMPAEMRAAGAVPHWLASIAVPDVDAAAAQLFRAEAATSLVAGGQPGGSGWP